MHATIDRRPRLDAPVGDENAPPTNAQPLLDISKPPRPSPYVFSSTPDAAATATAPRKPLGEAHPRRPRSSSTQKRRASNTRHGTTVATTAEGAGALRHQPTPVPLQPQHAASSSSPDPATAPRSLIELPAVIDDALDAAEAFTEFTSVKKPSTIPLASTASATAAAADNAILTAQLEVARTAAAAFETLHAGRAEAEDKEIVLNACVPVSASEAPVRAAAAAVEAAVEVAAAGVRVWRCKKKPLTRAERNALARQMALADRARNAAVLALAVPLDHAPSGILGSDRSNSPGGSAAGGSGGSGGSGSGESRGGAEVLSPQTNLEQGAQADVGVQHKDTQTSYGLVGDEGGAVAAAAAVLVAAKQPGPKHESGKQGKQGKQSKPPPAALARLDRLRNVAALRLASAADATNAMGAFRSSAREAAEESCSTAGARDAATTDVAGAGARAAEAGACADLGVVTSPLPCMQGTSCAAKPAQHAETAEPVEQAAIRRLAPRRLNLEELHGEAVAWGLPASAATSALTSAASSAATSPLSSAERSLSPSAGRSSVPHRSGNGSARRSRSESVLKQRRSSPSAPPAALSAEVPAEIPVATVSHVTPAGAVASAKATAAAAAAAVAVSMPATPLRERRRYRPGGSAPCTTMRSTERRQKGQQKFSDDGDDDDDEDDDDDKDCYDEACSVASGLTSCSGGNNRFGHNNHASSTGNHDEGVGGDARLSRAGSSSSWLNVGATFIRAERDLGGGKRLEKKDEACAWHLVELGSGGDGADGADGKGSGRSALTPQPARRGGSSGPLSPSGRMPPAPWSVYSLTVAREAYKARLFASDNLNNALRRSGGGGRGDGNNDAEEEQEDPLAVSKRLFALSQGIADPRLEWGVGFEAGSNHCAGHLSSDFYLQPTALSFGGPPGNGSSGGGGVFPAGRRGGFARSLSEGSVVPECSLRPLPLGSLAGRHNAVVVSDVARVEEVEEFEKGSVRDGGKHGGGSGYGNDSSSRGGVSGEVRAAVSSFDRAHAARSARGLPSTAAAATAAAASTPSRSAAAPRSVSSALAALGLTMRRTASGGRQRRGNARALVPKAPSSWDDDSLGAGVGSGVGPGAETVTAVAAVTGSLQPLPASTPAPRPPPAMAPPQQQRSWPTASSAYRWSTPVPWPRALQRRAPSGAGSHAGHHGGQSSADHLGGGRRGGNDGGAGSPQRSVASAFSSALSPLSVSGTIARGLRAAERIPARSWSMASPPPVPRKSSVAHREQVRAGVGSSADGFQALSTIPQSPGLDGHDFEGF